LSASLFFRVNDSFPSAWGPTLGRQAKRGSNVSKLGRESNAAGVDARGGNPPLVTCHYDLLL